ncbi:putative IS orf [Shigella sonnei]|nr:putative IS orf [Shigella sonnei]
MGVELPVSTMADMVGVAGAALAPLVKLLRHELLTRDVIHADETSLRLLDTRKGGKSKIAGLYRIEKLIRERCQRHDV